MDNKVMFNISYGLYVLTTKDDKQDNGCIINTFSQVTSNPNVVSIAVNKSNYTCDMIKKSKKFNVSILSVDSTFDIFERFGFHSGRDVDKFSNYDEAFRSENGLYFIRQGANSFISAEVFDMKEFETHIVFYANVTDGAVLSQKDSLTYDYYHKNVKPKKEEKKKGWVCKICGYVYEGDELPEDFVCPICKHPASDFEKI